MTVIAYTDGSYKEDVGSKGEVLKYYSSAAMYTFEGENNWQVITSADNAPEYIKSRNIAGEAFAVMQLCHHLMNLKDESGNKVNVDTVIINYDYAGIENWVTGAWKTGTTSKNPISRVYKEYMQKNVLPVMNIQFRHVKAHSGKVENETIDKIARERVKKAILEAQENS